MKAKNKNTKGKNIGILNEQGAGYGTENQLDYKNQKKGGKKFSGNNIGILKTRKTKKSGTNLIGKGILILLIAYFAWQLIDQQVKINSCNKLIAEIEKKTEEEKNKSELLIKEKNEIDTEQYVEKTARKKLGLLKKNEKVFVDINR